MLLNKLFGARGGATEAALIEDQRREPFSEFLPWVAYDPETGRYLNIDNTTGYLWECLPLTFCGQKEARTLEAIMRIHLQKGSVMQFMLYADPNIEPFIAQYISSKTRKSELTERSVNAFCEFLRQGVKGISTMQNIPLRNFRLFFSIKTPDELRYDNLSIIEEALKGANLCPQRMAVGNLLDWMRRLFNDHVPLHSYAYDATKPIRKQIIFAETAIHADRNQLRLGSKYARCATPKVIPRQVDLLNTNTLSGGIMGMVDDSKQINLPFLWTVNVIYDDLKAEIHRKASLTMAQKSTGSFAIQIQKRVEEFNWALDKIESENFLRMIPTLWVFADSEEEARDGIARARRIWETQGYVMQEESYIAKALFIASLPFGLYATPGNIKTIDRDFTPPSGTLSRLLPIQADFVGSPNPVLTFIGRKGQLVGLDLFESRANNHNFLVTAGSGAGKSFTLNYICSNYYAAGAMMRITDLGHSYKKLARTVKGRFLDFGKEKVCINPFHSASKEKEDQEFDLLATAVVIAEMVYSASGQVLTETEWTLIKAATRWAKNRDGGERGVDHVAEYLATFPKHAHDNVREMRSTVERAQEMAFNIKEFTSAGLYGRYFNGKSNFDISTDQFVVLELEHLKPQMELFKVVTLQVLNAVTQDLYLSDRSSRRFCLFDESWQYFGSGDRIGSMITEGYRRARKYSGAFGIVTQSLLDLKNFGAAGDVIRTNAAFKFYLEGSDYNDAVRYGLLDYEGLALTLVNSVKNSKPRYSEMFLDTPFGKGVVRLAVPRWTYWVNTSDGREVAKFEKLLSEGYDSVAALDILAKE